MAAPVAVPASSLNLATTLTNLVDEDESHGDSSPLISVLPRPTKGKLALRRARHILLPYPALVVLLGQDLARPTKDALRLLAKGEALAVAGEDVEFVRMRA